jgi:hypothetical protein
MISFPMPPNSHAKRWLTSALLNFWGLILGPAIGAVVSFILVSDANSRRDRAEQEKAQLEQRNRALEQTKINASAAPASQQTELENERLRADLEKLKAQTEVSGKRAAELEIELRAVKQQLTAVLMRTEATPTPELRQTKANATTESPGMPPPRQRLERFLVEVPRAQLSSDGSATVYVTFISTTSTRLKMLLAGGFLNQGKTFLVDDVGQRYDAEQASGIGTCCFGFAGGDWQGNILDVAPRGTAEVTFTFRRGGRSGEPVHEAQSFTLTSELTIGDAVQVHGWHGLQWRGASSASIRIAGIPVR